jgi:hypothetical protein
LRGTHASYQVLSCEHDAEASFLLAGSDFPYLMSIQRPVATVRAIRAFRFLPHNVKRSLLPMFLQRMEMFSKALDSLEVRSMLREISSWPEVA